MYVFIINPIAGNGRGRKVYEKLKASSLFRDLHKKVFFTKRKGHATTIVKELTSDPSLRIKVIIIVGGDGTIHDAVNGIQNYPVKIGFIPGGSGNDFARGCKIKGHPVKLLEDIVEGRGKIDFWLGNYKILGKENKFANNVGFGFDAEVAKRANESKYKRFLSKFALGNISYLFALIHILFSFKPKKITLSHNGKERVIENCWMITISNHPYYGGGMKIAPTAKIQPDTFTVLIVHSISKWKVLALFLTVFTGSHIKYKEVDYFEADRIKISSEEKIYFHADGETSTCLRASLKKEGNTITIYGSLLGNKQP